MESCVIKLTESGLENGKLNIRACGRDFFPPDGKDYSPTVSHFLFDLNASIAYNPQKDKP